MKLYSKEELKNSRIFFDKKPAPFLRFLAILFIILIVIALIFLKFIPKNYIVKAVGTVETDDREYVTPLANANIIEIKKLEGEEVARGDILFTLSVGSEGAELIEIGNQIAILEKKREIFNKYEISLNDKKNYMNNSGDEQEFYGKVEYYLTTVKSDNKQQSDNDENMSRYNSELKSLKDELEIIGKNNSQDYQKEYAKLKKQLDDTIKEKEELENKVSSDDIYSEELDIVQSEISSLESQLADLKDQYEEKLEIDLNAKMEEIKSKEEEIRSLENYSQEQSLSLYQQLISELGTAKTQNEDKISELNSQKNLKEVEGMLLNVVANKEGIVHYLVPLKTGLGVQAYQPIAQIDQGEDSNLIVECFISAQDRSKVSIGDETKVTLSGVNQTKYGLLKGTVKSIGHGTMSQDSEEGTQLLYQVVVELEETSLKRNKEEIKAEAAMPVIANIVYKKETYLDWLMEQLNFTR